MKENNPTDATASIRVMERCLQKFTDCPLYLQDARFLQIWILYINTQDYQNGKQTFAYMRSHKIGTNLALFYLAESLLHEENSDFETTEHLYQEGITKCCLSFPPSNRSRCPTLGRVEAKPAPIPSSNASKMHQSLQSTARTRPTSRSPALSGRERGTDDGRDPPFGANREGKQANAVESELRSVAGSARG